MRHARTALSLIICFGMIAALAFAQYPPASLAGSWTASLRTYDGNAVTVRIDLTQNGNRIAGREQITRPDFAVTLKLEGQLAENRSGFLQQTSVEQLRGIEHYCLQGADFRITGPDTIAMHLRPDQCGTNEVFNLTRVGSSVVPDSAPALSINGSWAVTYKEAGGPTQIRFDLIQSGSRIDGLEQIADARSHLAVRLSGQLSENGTTGFVQETVVERNENFRTPCLQGASLRVTSPTTLSLLWRPSLECGGEAGAMTLRRMIRQEQIAAPTEKQMLDANRAFIGGLISRGLAAVPETPLSAQEREIREETFRNNEINRQNDEDARRREQERKEQ
jgi:hypothetical protein